MSDIIFALKSKKANLSMKLESCVKCAENGVYFYSSSNVALDIMELTSEDILRLISEIQLTGAYDYIIVDSNFSIDREAMKLYRKAHTIVWIGDGSEISNTKLFRAYSALNILEQNAESPILNRMVLIYNKFSSKTGQTLNDIGMKNIGGTPVFVHATSTQVVEQLSENDMFDAIM